MDLFDVPPPVGLRPNLAGTYKAEKQKFPCYASPKIDGIRALTTRAGVLSRSLKKIPNSYVQHKLNLDWVLGLDGELVVGPANHPNAMQATSSGMMKRTGSPDFTFYVFDDWTSSLPYQERFAGLKRLESSGVLPSYLKVLEQVLLHDQEQLDAYEAKCIAEGYEGVMLRDPNGKYKMGRSTVNEGGLIKVKRYSHGEAQIVGFNELMHNLNEEYTDELGHTARSSHQENLVPSGRLGSYTVWHPNYETTFDISTGSMTHEQQAWAWVNRELTRGAITRFKHFDHGVKNVPRHGLWAGFRSLTDMDPTHPLQHTTVINEHRFMSFPGGN